MNLRKIILTALFMAIGVLSAHLIVIPVGVAKCFPVQHAINILLAVLVGTRGAVMGSFGIALLRNLLYKYSLVNVLLNFSPVALFNSITSNIIVSRPPLYNIF